MVAHRARLAAPLRIGARDALVAVALTVAIAGGYVFANQPRGSRAGLLRDLYASPLCLAGAEARAGSPTVRQAWSRTIGTPITMAKADFVGTTTVILYYTSKAGSGQLTFLRAEGTRWRYSDDLVTAAWAARVCDSQRRSTSTRSG